MATPTPDELNKFCAQYTELSSTARKLGLIRTILTWVLFVTVIGFVWSIFSKFQEMYTAKNFEKPLMEQAEIIKPQVLTSLKNVYEDAMPEIVAAGKAGFEKVRPELEARAHDELHSFTEFTGKHLDMELAGVFHRVAKHHEDRLVAHFPGLMEVNARDLMKKRLEKKLETLMGDMLLEIHGRYFAELQRLEKTLGRFRTARFENPEHKEDLALYYTHLWLMALDQYLILNSGQFASQPPVHPSTVPATPPAAAPGSSAPKAPVDTAAPASTHTPDPKAPDAPVTK